MNFLTWIVFGSIAGVLATLVDPHPEQRGILGAIILGILGAVVGGMLAELMFGIGISEFSLMAFMVAVGGSLGLLFISKIFKEA